MSEAKHTPGRWSISRGGLPHDDGFSICTDQPGMNAIVAECWPCTSTPESRAMMLADAHLITAAPDLLAACNAYKQLMLTHFFSQPSLFVTLPEPMKELYRAANILHNQMQAAISKAEASGT